MVQARCGRTVRWDTALTAAENSAVLSFKHGIKVYVTDVESSLQQKPWWPRSQSCPREPDQGHPCCMKSPKSSSAVVIGQGLHPFNSHFPTPVFLLNSLRKKMQLHLHPEPLPSSNKHNICNHRKTCFNCNETLQKVGSFF